MSASSKGDAHERRLRARQSDLRRRLLDKLQRSPGAVGVELFGSLANGGGDGFSDIDLHVLTRDPAASIAARRQVLSGVGPVLLEWRICPAVESFAAVILFRDESCYHKVDLGFQPLGCDDDSDLTAAAEEQSEADPYSPLVGTSGHLLMDQLLGATRYVKARKRGQHLTCWRFAAAAAEQVMRLAYESLRGWQDLGHRLSTTEYLWLDEALGENAALDLLRHLRFDSPQTMDASMLALCRRMATLSWEKADAMGDRIPDAPVTKLLGFIEAELMGQPGERGQA